MFHLSQSSLFLGTSATSSLAFLGQENCLDVGQDTTLSDRYPSHQLVQLLIIPSRIDWRSGQKTRHIYVPDGQLQMSGNDARFLVVPGSVTSQLQDLGGQILHDSCHVHRSTSPHPLRIVTFPAKQSCTQEYNASTPHLRSLWILPTGN